MKSIEEQINDIQEGGKSGGTKPLSYEGKLQELPWYEIPTELLRYNYLNGRIATETLEFNQLGKDLNSIDKNEANKLVSDWIWKKSLKENEKTLKNLDEVGQVEPGVITRDGIIIDGNRRFMLTCKLNEKLTSKRFFKAVILDITYGDAFYMPDGQTNNNAGANMPQLELEYNILFDDDGPLAGTPATPGGLQIEIDQTFDLDLDRVYGAGNINDPFSQGDGSNDPSGQGSKVLNDFEFVQQNLPIVQDITVEVEMIQDFTQVQEIEQTINQPIAATATRPAD